jgi:hypothetical protein
MDMFPALGKFARTCVASKCYVRICCARGFSTAFQVRSPVPAIFHPVGTISEVDARGECEEPLRRPKTEVLSTSAREVNQGAPRNRILASRSYPSRACLLRLQALADDGISLLAIQIL